MMQRDDDDEVSCVPLLYHFFYIHWNDQTSQVSHNQIRKTISFRKFDLFSVYPTLNCKQ